MNSSNDVNTYSNKRQIKRNFRGNQPTYHTHIIDYIQ